MSNCAVLDHPFVLIYATGGALEDPMTFPSIKAASAWASAQDWDEDDACRLYEVRDGQMHCLLRFDDITDPNLFTRPNINDLPDRVKTAILAAWAEQRPMLVRKVKLTEEERLALIDYFNDAYWNTAVPRSSTPRNFPRGRSTRERHAPRSAGLPLRLRERAHLPAGARPVRGRSV